MLLATALVLPGAVSEPAPDIALVATSFLFLPWRRPDGLVQPLFRLGWTLNYEMLFYAVFALFVPLRARVAVPCVVIAICGLAGLGWAMRPEAVALAFWTDPIILEFALGAVLGAVAGQVQLPRAMRAGLVLSGLAGLKVAEALPEVPHGVAFGLPCLALVAGAVLGRPSPGRPLALRAAIVLGDISYALYLVHPFPMRALALIWPKMGMVGSVAGVMGYVAAAVAVSVALAWGVHVWVERPLTEAARRVLRGRGVRMASASS